MCLDKNIRFLRKKYGLSQEDIAKQLGYKSYTTIQKWEMGVSEPSIGTLKQLADIFQVNINDMATKDLEAEQSEPNIPNIGEEEWALINRYRALSPVLQKTVLSLLATVEEMSKTQEEQSAGEVS